jgi:hypothetical protein
MIISSVILAFIYTVKMVWFPNETMTFAVVWLVTFFASRRWVNGKFF